MRYMFLVVVVSVLQLCYGDRNKMYIMDDKDRIVGCTYDDKFIAEAVTIGNHTLPSIPMGTSIEFQTTARKYFPRGSINITVDAPWRKHVSTCTHSHDSHLTHYFQETKFVWSNDICALSGGKYTWIITSDYQISFGKYVNNYEFGTKHSNIAMMRPGYVAGELIVIPSSIDTKHIIGWNLLSGTYSEPISESMNATDPNYYLDNFLMPMVDEIWKSTECYDNLYYNDSEFFFPVLPSIQYVSWACENNLFVKNYESLTWDSNGQSVCDSWGPGVCGHNK